MDPSRSLMDEVRSLHVKFDSMTKMFASLDQKIKDITDKQQMGDETGHKPANSINIIIGFLAALRKLSPEELKNTLVEADAILNTVNPMPINQNLDATQEWHTTKNKLKVVLNEVFDLLNSLPLTTNNTVASESSRCHNNKVEEKKIQFWRKYKNKYNYIEKLKLKLPPLNDSNEEVESPQNEANRTVHNVLNDTAQNYVTDVNDPAHNDVNDKTTYTLNDIIQNEDVYEMFKSRLKNSPYDDPAFKNNVRNSTLTLTLHNGETIVRPVRHVAPLIVLKKCDDLCPTPLQNKKVTGKHFPSTSKIDSNRINDSNCDTTTVKMTKRQTRSSKTSDVTNSVNTNVKTSTKKRRSTTKNSKPSKKKKKN